MPLGKCRVEGLKSVRDSLDQSKFASGGFGEAEERISHRKNVVTLRLVSGRVVKVTFFAYSDS